MHCKECHKDRITKGDYDNEKYESSDGDVQVETELIVVSPFALCFL
jgi:hypothetical protein